ncbi:hypothetical protein BU16DRAFT_544908 [Lophium mytilinum]|uniref:Uncharacterized protein n=1 Tax=Lophium mytilinum TaxID=390894 RepID=A0A6A6QDK4_9PEZI|nr:hypothetical protein BU16DRAFT_544908 [Lophium mytilinum]
MRFSDNLSILVAASQIGAAVAGPVPQYGYGQPSKSSSATVSASTASESTAVTSTKLSPTEVTGGSSLSSSSSSSFTFFITTVTPPVESSTVISVASSSTSSSVSTILVTSGTRPGVSFTVPFTPLPSTGTAVYPSSSLGGTAVSPSSALSNYTIPFTLPPPSTTELSPTTSSTTMLAFPSSSLITPSLGTAPMSPPPFPFPFSTYLPTGSGGASFPVPTVGSNLTISYSLAPSLVSTQLIPTFLTGVIPTVVPSSSLAATEVSSSAAIPSSTEIAATGVTSYSVPVYTSTVFTTVTLTSSNAGGVVYVTSVIAVSTTVCTLTASETGASESAVPSTSLQAAETSNLPPVVGTGTGSFPSGSGFPPSPSGTAPGSSPVLSYSVPILSSTDLFPISTGSPVITPVGAPSSSAGSPDTTVWTTSVVYTTTVITTTLCASEFPNCPAHSTHVITSVIPVYTTVCPLALTTDTTDLFPTFVPSAFSYFTGPGATGPVGTGSPTTDTTDLFPTFVPSSFAYFTGPDATGPVGTGYPTLTASSGFPSAPPAPTSSISLSVSYSLAPTAPSTSLNAVSTGGNVVLNTTALFPTGTEISTAVAPVSSSVFSSGVYATTELSPTAVSSSVSGFPSPPSSIPHFTLPSSLVPYSTLVTSSRTIGGYGGNGAVPTSTPTSAPPVAPPTNSKNWWAEFQKWLQELAAWFKSEEKKAKEPKN